MAFSFIICVFMYVDAWFVPADSSPEEVISSYTRKSKGHRTHLTRTTSKIETLTDKYSVDPSFYEQVNDHDIITVHRSTLTNAIQKITLEKEGQSISQKGYIRGGYGAFFTGFLIFLIFISFATYNFTENVKLRSNGTYFVLICSLVLLLLHIGIF